MAPVAEPVALMAQKAEALEARAGLGMQSLVPQNMEPSQQLLSKVRQQRTSYCLMCQVCCPPRHFGIRSRGRAAEHAAEAVSMAAASQTVNS